MAVATGHRVPFRPRCRGRNRCSTVERQVPVRRLHHRRFRCPSARMVAVFRAGTRRARLRPRGFPASQRVAPVAVRGWRRVLASGIPAGQVRRLCRTGGSGPCAQSHCCANGRTAAAVSSSPTLAVPAGDTARSCDRIMGTGRVLGAVGMASQGLDRPALHQAQHSCGAITKRSRCQRFLKRLNP